MRYRWTAALVPLVVIGLGLPGTSSARQASSGSSDGSPSATSTTTGTTTTTPTGTPTSTTTGAETSSTTVPATTPASAPEPTATLDTLAVAPRSLQFAVSGDVLTHLPVVRAACGNGTRATDCDFSRLLADTARLISAADLAICHLEVPVVAPGRRVSGYPLFGAPRSLTRGLASVGWDRCSTASNHSLDQGVGGIDATLDALDAAGLGHSGTARNPDEARPMLFEVNGIRIAHLSASYGFNGLRRPTDQPWRANLIDPARLVAHATEARARGAEIVVLSLHWGQEYRINPTAEQRRVAEAVTRDGLVDLVVGHHAHVVQPISQVNGTWILWGLGNHVSAQTPSGGRPAGVADGVIVTVRLQEVAPGEFRVDQPVAHPTWVEPSTRRVRLVGPDDGSPARRASWARTARTLGRYVSRSSRGAGTG